MDLVGEVLGNRYEILEKIGSGGMADVYKARCNLLNRYVAVKVLKNEFSRDETFVKRFKAEAQAAASLTHPNIVSVYDVGQEAGINYIVMELLETKTLKDYIEEHGALDSDSVLKISAQIASALETAHKSHIIHRDIKPQNIVLNKNMVAKVTDFGIAKISSASTITTMGNTMGSVHYFSPEQAKGGYTDERSDIYSLGVVMYEMATAKLPFDADSPVSVALKHIQEEPKPPIEVNPNVSPALNEIILKAMQKNVVSRYQNAAEILSDIYVALKEPNKLIVRNTSSVEAGATQVIPIIAMKDNEQSNVPNLRTRQSRRVRIIENDNKDLAGQEDDSKEDSDQEIAENTDKNKKGKSKKRLVIIIIVILVILGISTFIGIKMYKSFQANKLLAQQITIPDLTGKKFDDVVNQYKDQGITIVQGSTKSDDKQPAGYILSQDQAAGTKTNNKTITVVVSSGPKLVTVTDVTGEDVKVAKYELEQTLGLKVEETDVISQTVASGLVVSQDPGKDAQVAVGSIIKLNVSKGDGKAQVTMPSVLGKTEADATKTLQDLKLTVTVNYDSDSSKDNRVVITQSYPQNQQLKEGDLVTITVNKLQVTKTVNLDVPTLLKAANITASEDKQVTIKVDASIDAGATNTVYNQKIDSTEQTVSFDINGYTDAKLQIYVEGNKVKDQTISFTD